MSVEPPDGPTSKPAKRAGERSYLRDFVYGGIDGAVTTFAVVSGVAGAGLSSGVVVVLGFANLIGDGFSMAASNFLGTRADLQLLQLARQQAQRRIRQDADREREAVSRILTDKGFSGQNLQQAIRIYTNDEDRWIDLVLQEEYGLALEQPNPFRAAFVTFAAFLAVGLLPLLSFAWQLWDNQSNADPFFVSTVLTAVAFFAVGAVKSRFVAGRWYWSGLETLAVGGLAALLAFLVGRLLQGVADNVPP